ncbi:hypothetical protein J6590_021069 [Homalodisca vitripennis]|nr:hypothetical protein J6590_021069 [Homalodisca vitripennis]
MASILRYAFNKTCDFTEKDTMRTIVYDIAYDPSSWDLDKRPSLPPNLLIQTLRRKIKVSLKNKCNETFLSF